jgi:phosphoribosylanthranilate isomerase
MRRIAVKICGITRLADAVLAANCGATHIGLIFAEASPRKVKLADAKQIAEAVGKQTAIVGVFQNQASEFICELHREVEFDFIQYHGDEQPSALLQMVPAIKAMSGNVSELNINSYEAASAMLLFDRPKSVKQAEHGKPWWQNDLLQTLALHPPSKPFLIAGGIDEIKAIQALKDFARFPTFAGIDLASAVESEPGIKDPQKLQAIFGALKQERGYAISR